MLLPCIWTHDEDTGSHSAIMYECCAGFMSRSVRLLPDYRAVHVHATTIHSNIAN